MELHPGMVAEKNIIVESRHTAAHLGSGGVEVYATPTMVLHMEETSRDVVEKFLGPGKASVGSFVGVRHLAPTPVGMKVRICSELLKVDGRILHFKVEAWDEVEKVGEGEHTRVVIDVDRFHGKLQAKINTALDGGKHHD